MATASNAITFVITGHSQPTAGASADLAPLAAQPRGSVKALVRVGTQRDGATPVRVTARPGEDIVVLTIANGPTLVLHPQDARDLMQSQAGAGTRSASATPGSAGEVLVNAQLGWPGLEAGATRGAARGWMGQALLSAFAVVTDLVADPAVSLATASVTQRVDGGVDAGVYLLSADALPARLKGHTQKLAQVPAAPDGGPLLVLVHGTFVDTVATFGSLWTRHPATVRRLFARYQNRVYALDHPTLGSSPIGNALTLVQALPDGARLHLLTHSRGGLAKQTWK